MIDAPAYQGPRRQLYLCLILLTALGASLAAAPGADGLFGAFLAALMIAIAAVDAKQYIIPNELTAAAVGLALLRAAIAGPDAGPLNVCWTAVSAIASALPLLILMTAYRRWRGREGLGLGDVKLVAVAGAWLDWVTLLAVIELAALTALGGYLAASYFRDRPLKATAFLPFGLFLAPAVWIGWLIEALTN